MRDPGRLFRYARYTNDFTPVAFGSIASVWHPIGVRLSLNFGHIGPLSRSTRSARGLNRSRGRTRCSCTVPPIARRRVVS
jgi:hypothetical protein